jgi:hypothetical protein
VIKIGGCLIKQLGEQKLPPDFPLIVGYYTDCHMPLLNAATNVDTVHKMYRQKLSPEQCNFTPVAVGHPFGSSVCLSDDINRAWFGCGKGGSDDSATLYKLLSKGVASAFSNRYIGLQSERCLDHGGRPASVVFDMVAAVRLGALSHRSWSEMEWNPRKRAAVYAERNTEGTRAHIRRLTAKALQLMVSEYVVGYTSLLPATWRAATCMHGGHAYAQSIVQRHRQRPNSRGSGTGAKRRAARFPDKIPTRMIVACTPQQLASVLLCDAGPTPSGVDVGDAKTMQVLASSLRSGNFVVALPTETRAIQQAAVHRRSGQSSLTVHYCQACTVAHVKVHGASHPSKRRFGVVSRLDAATGTIVALQCATCLVKSRLVACDLVGVELHARLNVNSPPVVITVCGECGCPCANATYVGVAASCAQCVSATRWQSGTESSATWPPAGQHQRISSARRCLCRAPAEADGRQVNVQTRGGDIKSVLLCERHRRVVCKLPVRSVYPLEAVMHAVESNKAKRYKKKYTYLRF